jgi:hypothetical protein
MVWSKGRARIGFQQLEYLLTLITLLFASVTSLATCTATEKNAEFSADNGSEDTASLTANINAVGDLVAITAWCYPNCTAVSVTLGSQSAVATSNSGNAPITTSGGTPGSAPGTGRGWIYYILSAAASGSQTVTWTVSGSHTDIQVSYIDFSPSAGCHFAHNVDSPLGSYIGSNSDTGNGTINAASITPTTGDLLFNFTWTSEHINSVNSPWSCPIYVETGTCEFTSTINAAAYILSAASGSIANNMTDLHNTASWQALITSFSMKFGVDSPPNPPTGLTLVVQ